MTEHALNRETYLRLIEVAGERHDEAERCAEAGAWIAACAMLGAALEAVLLVTASNCEFDLRARGLWPAGDPLGWGLGRLVRLAVDAGWFPTAQSGQSLGLAALGDAVDWVRFLRNLVHPGALVRDLPPNIAVGETAYRNAFEVLEAAFAETLGAANRAEATQSFR